ncbi:MAG TPA: iron-containing redox enzyme family protein [Labilithrix sp.]|nr:iron-containing redox enzyme family protein [Labilithrix sp.]
MKTSATHARQFTEPIFRRLAEHDAELAQHPMLTAAREGELTAETLRDFAFHQLSDSILWIPMLAQMKSKAVRSRRLRRAIEDNIAHEAGLGGVSHVTLAVALMRSLGVRDLGRFPTVTFEESASLWVSDDFASFGEAEVAGFLLCAETLVPRLFAAMLPAFERLGCDTRYFVEHVAIDGDEHSTWMAEAVLDVANEYGPSCVAELSAGLEDAWQEVREVPDGLWRGR